MQNEKLQSWIEKINQEGPLISLERLEEIIEEADEEIRKTQIFNYYLGFYDAKLLMEEFGGV